MFLGLFRYPRTTWRCSTKLFTNWLGCCVVKSWYVFFLALCCPLSLYLKMVHFACSSAHSDTWVLFLYISQVLLYSGKGQYTVYSLSTRTTFLWEDLQCKFPWPPPHWHFRHHRNPFKVMITATLTPHLSQSQRALANLEERYQI